MKSRRRRIWIDLDNSPHVPFFIPIVKQLEKRGHSVFLTTRDCFQVCSLADYHRLNHTIVGRHYGANRVLKVLGTVWRSLQLVPLIIKKRPDVSISHGSRSLILVSSLLRIPTILLFDYEHAKRLPIVKPVIGIAPELINGPELQSGFRRGLRPYRGLKEDVYVSSFKPDASVLKDLGLSEGDIIATIRPPATEAHYHNPDSERLFSEVVEYLGDTPNVRMVILPRNETAQREVIINTWPQWIKEGKVIVPDHALNGLDLIWYSDLVVSGGGTMNREAAALGVPVYSIFRGELGAVDRYLADQGRLTLIDSPEEVRSMIRPVRRNKARNVVGLSDEAALKDIMTAIDEVIT